MADKKNGEAAPEKGLSKMEAVRRALAHMGRDAKPAQLQPYIKDKFGIQMGLDHISTCKGDILKKEAQTGKPAAQPAAAKPATSKPAAQPAAAQQTAAPKPAAAKPAGTKPGAPKPAAPKAAPMPPAVAQPQANGQEGHGRITVQDVDTVKELLGRLGADQLRGLIDVLAR